MRIVSYLKEANWKSYNIGFIEFEPKHIDELDVTKHRIHWLNVVKYKEGWFADPFILEANQDFVVLLAEEMHGSKGRIVRLTVNRKGYKLEKVDVVLELPTHLSFPIYLEHNGEVYIYPENYQGGGVFLYKYDRENYKAGIPIKIINDPLLDTQICKIDDYYYAFGVRYVTGENIDTRDLQIYKSKEIFEEFEFVETIRTTNNRERGAGMIFEMDEKLIRPTQKCDNSYGEVTILKELNNTENGINEIEIMTISPKYRTRWDQLLHSFNFKDGVTVIDGLGYTHPILHKLVSPFNLLKDLKFKL